MGLIWTRESMPLGPTTHTIADKLFQAQFAARHLAARDFNPIFASEFIPTVGRQFLHAIEI
jgi:hypothetical protein